MNSFITLQCLAVNLFFCHFPSTGAQKEMLDPKSISAISVSELPSNPFFIEADQVLEITQKSGITVDELLQRLVPVAQQFARPSISNYYVGVAALGKSGAIYLGVNLEFPGVPLNQTVHAEQFLVALARSHGEREIVAMALSAPPCGHCRQFLYEMSESSELQLYIKDSPPVMLSTLLPIAFGPQNLGLSGSILSQVNGNYVFTMDYSLRTFALMAIVDSYAPCSNAKSGIALQTNDGRIYKGSYLETVAFNPSLSPLQVALVSFVADGRSYDEISSVLLLEQEEAKISQEMVTREVLKQIAPQAELMVEKRVLLM